MFGVSPRVKRRTQPGPIVTTTNAGQCVVINSKIATVFSEAMNPQTITSSTYFVQNGTTLIPGTVIASGSNAIFTPDSFFAPLTHFTVTLKSGGPATGVHDMVCNTLYSDYVWDFTTCDRPGHNASHGYLYRP